MRTDPRFQKWCRWVDTISLDVQDLYVDRDIFTGVMEIVQKNDQIDKRSPFFVWFQHIYADSVIMGIRRQLKDKDINSISLARLLTEVADNPELVTRSDFLQLSQDPCIQSRMEATFDLFATPGSPYIDGNRVKNDLKSLKNTCKAAEDYADRRIAHYDKREPTLSLTGNSIFTALDFIGELVQRYYMLLLGKSFANFHPSLQVPILNVFEKAWMVSSHPTSSANA